MALNYAGPITVTANMGSFSPNPVEVNNPATANLSASYNSPSGVSEGDLSAQYDWSVANVQYKALQADSFGSAPSGSYTDSISPTQPSTSSSATLTFTPLIAGYWRVSMSCSVTVIDVQTAQYWGGSANAGPEDLTSYTLDITYTGPVVVGSTVTTDNGTVVTNETQDVHAGWPIEVGVSVAPSDLANEFDWTIDGAGGNGSAAIAGYSHTTQIATVDALGQQYGYSVLYYYTASGSHDVTVTTKNGYEVPSVWTKFSVVKPTSAMSASYQYATQIAPANGGVADYIYLEAVAALAGPSLAQSGIVFSHPLVRGASAGDGTAFRGASYFVQVYTGDQEWYGIPPVANFPYAGSGLDGTDPYGQNVVVDGADYQGDSPALPTDRSPNKINYSSLTVNDSPQMWVMYTPAASGSIDVPIDSAPWRWGGTVSWDANTSTWTLASPSPAAPSKFSGPATGSYPVWDGVWVPEAPPQ